ncbi:DUF502 domain-containing protein [soil metagenome]
MTTLFRKINSIFLKGLLTLLPIALTVSLLIWVIRSLEASFGGALTTLLPDRFYVPGLGLVLAVLAILATGLIVENYLAGNVLRRLEDLLKNTPVIKTIYSPLKDLADLFSRTKNAGHGQQVVFVQTAPGIEAMGLVMREHFNDLPNGTVPDGRIAVFIPLSYGFGGFTLVVDRSVTRDAGLPAERALQLAITGWVRSGR